MLNALCMSYASAVQLSLAPRVSAARVLRVIRVVFAPVPGAPHQCCTRSARHTCRLLFYRPRRRRTTRSPSPRPSSTTITASRTGTTGNSRCMPQRNSCTKGTSPTERSRPHPPGPGIPPAPEVDEGGGIDFPLKKEEDEAEPSGGAPEPEPKLEEKVVQETEQEALPEAKLEDKQQPADPREPPPARGEPLLTQKGPEADAATGGGTGCGCVPSRALSPFRMSGSDVALGTGGSALRVLRVLRVGFMRVPAFCASALCGSPGTSGAACMFPVSCRMGVSGAV